MFRNYLAAALRNLVRNRLYSAINITGLALGFTAALLIALFARDELTYDQWIPGHERIYRVSAHITLGGVKDISEEVPLGVADALKQEFPEVEAATRFTNNAGRVKSIRQGDREFLDVVAWADPNIFDVFPLPTVAGDLKTALDDPDSVVLTRTVARKYFGSDAPIGRTIEIDRQAVMRVTAVLEDLPSNTHLSLAVIASGHSSTAPNYFRDPTQIGSSAFTYIRLKPGPPVENLRQGLAAFNERHPEYRKPAFPFWVDEIIPLADIHLHPAARIMPRVSMKTPGSAATAYSALAIAALILAIAAINFVNLATARAVRRAVEVGVRKTSGAARRQLIAQFIGESVIYAILGMVAAGVGATLLMPGFNGFLQRTIALDFARDHSLLAATLSAVVIIGVAAGTYPAFVLSRFSPAAVLKGATSSQRARGKGRQVLVSLQFAVLIVLAVVSAVIRQQVHYATTDALRLNTDQTLIINGACPAALAAEIRALPGVGGVACTIGGAMMGSGPSIDIAAPSGTITKTGIVPVDFGVFELYGLRPAAGRFFSSDFGSDAAPEEGAFAGPSGVVINETLSRALGFAAPEDAIGKVVRFRPPLIRNKERLEVAPEIVGVVPDFKSLTPRTLREENLPPRVFWVDPGELRRFGSINVKLAGSRIPETLAAIDGLWKQLGPPRPIDRAFLDQSIEDLYREFTRLSETVALFAAIAVFISCLGLFGLAAFAAEQRTKEIGVRKALGASRADIVRLTLWDFSKPVLWGSLIAWPIGYVVTRQWLEGFADRIDIGLWMFPLASAAALAIAILTVIGHALLVARAQPVAALRYE